MAISGLYNRTVTTARLAAVGATKKTAWSENLVGLSCAIHPLESAVQDLGSGGFYTTFKLWCASGTDLKIGDKVTDESSNVYVVQSLATFDYGPSAHIRAIIVLGK